MAAVCLLLLVALLELAKGSDAGTSVFVQTGGDLNLDVTENDVPKDFIIFLWKFGTKGVVVTFYPNKQPQVQSPYTGRIESFENKFSVKLKNLQKKDSGVYIARLTTAEEQILTEYNVTVQDPVSPADLTVDSVSITPDSSSCNLTVTCRTEERNISRTFSCINRICNQEPRDRSKVPNLRAPLHMYLLNETIFCNHSNQVSWTESNKTIQKSCTAKTRNRDGLSVAIVIFLVIVAVIAVTAVACYLRKRGIPFNPPQLPRLLHIRDKRENEDNTIYATAMASDNHTQNESPADDAEHPSPITTYSEVNPTRIRPAETESKGMPESLYALVQRPAT
ncbi:uncharacterized protein LOC108232810 isoform X1 [Kryptolebias marmoratus]|uniref:uncharacterized protein LOC108232810 isoform X1 n=1 Tax=Kryptolebias marmoratus TaxID=37003 RepID=UPI0007F88D26|nr:uncharacterized protein LOC108232810 isoform X1 [Kryptolebias marmoratus]